MDTLKKVMQPKMSHFLSLFLGIIFVTASYGQSSFLESFHSGEGQFVGKMSNGHIFLLASDEASNYPYTPNEINFLTFAETDTTGKLIHFKKTSSAHFLFDRTSAVQTGDGHFIVVSTGRNIDSSNTATIEIFRMDESFKVDKFKVIHYQDSTGNNLETPYIFQSPDGGYNALIATFLGCVWMKFDSDINLQWSKMLTTGRSVFVSKMGGNVVLASGGTVMKFDKDAAFIAAKRLQVADASHLTHISSFFEDNNGGFLISGSYNTLGNPGSNFILKTDSSFNIRWANDYQQTGSSNFNIYAQHKNKYLAVGTIYHNIVGSSANSGFLSIDTAGSYLWERQFDDIYQVFPGQTALQYNDAADYFTGYDFGVHSGMLLAKVPPDASLCSTTLDSTTQQISLSVSSFDTTIALEDYSLFARGDSLRLIDTVMSTAYYCQSSLPLQLLSFSAQHKDNANQLSWQTTNEISTAYFNIERSRDSRSFEAIGKLASSNTNKMVHDYIFNDESPLQGTNYYRLKMVDGDGQFTYSKTISLNNKNSGFAAIIYPNPVSTSLTLQLNTASQSRVAVEVFNISGRKTLSTQCTAAAGQSSRTIDVKHLAAGIYMIHVSSSGGDKAVLKFVKR